MGNEQPAHPSLYGLFINVAQMCGFHSSPSFNAAFKVNMGETPSAFLERMRSERFAK